MINIYRKQVALSEFYVWHYYYWRWGNQRFNWTEASKYELNILMLEKDNV